jgi:F0F1-type ATP synthase membrane subunit b/b'
MPQFDSVTFLPQIFWLTLVFFAFYMVVIRYYLPGLTRIVKIRKKRLEAAQKNRR